MERNQAREVIISVIALDIHNNVKCHSGCRAASDLLAAEKWADEHPQLIDGSDFRSWPSDFTSEQYIERYGDKLYRLAFLPFVHVDRHRVAPHCGLKDGVILE